MLFNSPYKDGEYPKTVGQYFPETDSEYEVIKTEFFSDGCCEGYIYKNWINFYESINEVCYIPESEDSTYTAEDFYNIAAGNKDLAIDLFESCNWQHPETLLEEYLDSGSIIETEDSYAYAD